MSRTKRIRNLGGMQPRPKTVAIQLPRDIQSSESGTGKGDKGASSVMADVSPLMQRLVDLIK